MPELKFILFDLDGTLININSITQHIGDWDTFHEASMRCPPNEPVVEFARRCQLHSELIVVTGKPETYRRAATDWLLLQGLQPEHLLMRPALSDQSDATLKPALVQKALGDDWKEQVLFVVEDRDKAVNAWRALGLSCFQCAESLY